MEVVTVVEVNRIDKFERPRLAFPLVPHTSNSGRRSLQYLRPSGPDKGFETLLINAKGSLDRQGLRLLQKWRRSFLQITSLLICNQ